MANLFEFFFDLLMLIWNNVESLLNPLLNFLSKFTDFFIGILTDVLSWFMGAVEWIIDVFEKIADFFGAGTPPNFGGGGGRPR